MDQVEDVSKTIDEVKQKLVDERGDVADEA